MDKAHELLHFWFGDLGVADLPTSDRTNLWFGENDELRKGMLAEFKQEYDAAVEGQLDKWAETSRGRLALIILLDQFSRYLHRQSAQAFSQDKKAQQLCLTGIQNKMDQSLTLIERVFFYMPLVHAEDAIIQEQSIKLFQAYAYAHFRVIKEFGRFPQRNKVLDRKSSTAELNFLKRA